MNTNPTTERRPRRSASWITTVAAMLTLAGMGLTLPASGVVLDDDRRLSVKLEDGTDVVLYGAAGDDSPVSYYYLPPRLTVAISDDGRPEFLFMKFMTDENAENGGVSGALLHFLLKWGLTTGQEDELREIIEAEHSGELAGAAPMFAAAGDDPSFSIISATLGNTGKSESLVTVKNASLVPGGKVAAAAKLDKNGAQLLARTFEQDSTITDVSAVFNMAYETQLPAAKGRVVIDWSKIAEDSARIEAEYKRTLEGRERGKAGCFVVFCHSSSRNVYSYSYDEMRSEFSYLSEQKYITFEFEERVADERVEKIREAFINYFINSMSNPADAAAPDGRTEDGEGAGEDLDIRKGARYTYNVDRVRTRIQQGRQEFRMDYKLTLRWPYQLVGNMKSWYAEAASDPHAVQSVILGDPFYDWRDIVFLVDSETRSLFGTELNYVTINVRKQRSEGWFEDSVTIDEGHVKTNGNRATITYARGDDGNGDVYQYKVQMSFRGGRVYPENPEWQNGNWQGVTLAAPLRPRTVELEGDLDELEEAGVTRVTAQLRYPRLGEEREENIQLRVRGKEPIAEKKIFMDPAGEGYVFRLVLNHKRLGRMALPWSKCVSDDYIYASLPEELYENLLDSVVEGVVQNAKDAVEAEAGDQLAKFDILLSGE